MVSLNQLHDAFISELTAVLHLKYLGFWLADSEQLTNSCLLWFVNVLE